MPEEEAAAGCVPEVAEVEPEAEPEVVSEAESEEAAVFAVTASTEGRTTFCVTHLLSAEEVDCGSKDCPQMNIKDRSVRIKKIFRGIFREAIATPLNGTKNG